MRLAYLTSRFPYAYLGETFFVAEARLLARLCAEVHVIPARPQLRSSAFAGLGTIDVRMGPADAGTLLRAAMEAAAHPVCALKALRAILFARYAVKAKLKNLALFPKALAVARYVRIHEIEHIHAHWLTTSSTVAYVVSMMTGIPWSCTAHAHDIFSHNLTEQKTGSARFVRVISARNRDSLSALTRHRYDDRIYVGHLGVEVPAPAPSPAGEDTMLTMVCPARLHPMKGHMDLLEALAVLRDKGRSFRCDLAGEGDLRNEISRRIADLGLQSHVRMRGMVEHAVLLAELRCGTYDLVVLSSVEDPELKGFFEGIPVALIEAMAAGIPCVATRIGSIGELIDDQSGTLVEQHAPADLAEAMHRLAANASLRHHLGQAARGRVIAHFDAGKTTQALYDLIVADAASGARAGHSAAAAVSRPASMPAANAN